jgi:hypothetical protein
MPQIVSLNEYPLQIRAQEGVVVTLDSRLWCVIGVSHDVCFGGDEKRRSPQRLGA